VPADASLEPLRCRRGCDPRFLQYLCWEGTDLRIVTEASREFVLGVGMQTTYHLGVRCGDCGLHIGARNVPEKSKQALDSLLITVSHDLQDLADQVDTDLLAELLGGSALLMEGNGE